MEVKTSDQCSVPTSLHVDLKFSPPRPFLLSSLANTLLDVAHHTYRVTSAKGYAITKGSHVLAMLALFVGSRPHPLTSAEKVTCSLCSHCS